MTRTVNTQIRAALALILLLCAANCSEPAASVPPAPPPPVAPEPAAAPPVSADDEKPSLAPVDAAQQAPSKPASAKRERERAPKTKGTELAAPSGTTEYEQQMNALEKELGGKPIPTLSETIKELGLDKPEGDALALPQKKKRP